MQARYYDPIIGRFYSNDPVDAASFISDGEVQGFGRYTYAFNNPYKYTDPDGKNPRIDRRLKPIAKAVANALGGKQAVKKVEAHFTVMNPNATVKQMEAAIKTIRPNQTLAKTDRFASKPSIKEQGKDLVDANAQKSRVTMRSPSQKIEIDLQGKSHGGVPTPHTKVSPANLQAPSQPAFNTRGASTTATTQQQIRTARKFLEKTNG
ncbi:MAG: RHS repeat-associated core domain-containing protein [Paraglaciecola sp.]|uniref:RHS repeat-associated core domain-containing protein n=1 Tax=Paraglaciecola sp. TaxID=1920173 RepID=UPI003297AB91